MTDLHNGGGQLASRREQIHLKDNTVPLSVLFEHIEERRVGDETPVPVVVVVDPHRRETRRKRAAGHDVAHIDALFRGIEIDEIAATHVDGADRKPQRTAIDAIEVDELFQRTLQRKRVVVADGSERAFGLQSGRWHPGAKEPGHTEQQ